MTPGSTTAMRSTGLISRIRSILVRDSTMQPSEALAAAGQAGAGALRDDRDAQLGGGAHDVLDLFDGARQHDDGRGARLAEARHVVGVRGRDVRVGEDRLGGQAAQQTVDEVAGRFVTGGLDTAHDHKLRTRGHRCEPVGAGVRVPDVVVVLTHSERHAWRTSGGRHGGGSPGGYSGRGRGGGWPRLSSGVFVLGGVLLAVPPDGGAGGGGRAARVAGAAGPEGRRAGAAMAAGVPAALPRSSRPSGNVRPRVRARPRDARLVGGARRGVRRAGAADRRTSPTTRGPRRALRTSLRLRPSGNADALEAWPRSRTPAATSGRRGHWGEEARKGVAEAVDLVRRC